MLDFEKKMRIIDINKLENNKTRGKQVRVECLAKLGS
jgi:hypothetical protein